MLEQNSRWRMILVLSLIMLGLSGCASKTPTGVISDASIGDVAGAMLGNSKSMEAATSTGTDGSTVIRKCVDEQKNQ
ncbi:hypothetical protein Nitsa_0034 [Nitratifractor salsuginis DSM 16511]|uniref:Lipoprotein n=2 Tax=Nitratifractor salsuginis TaxID=269261 RepID=E6WY60_NITSE|nr:hypothetical protein Nitsa_0034 [Nitratifractor salsuginis DSM 16511]